MATKTKTPKLSDKDLAELIALTKGADSVELKLTVPVSDRSRGAAALGVDPLDAQIRQVYFFDTPDLTLNKRASSFAPAASSGRGTIRSSSCARLSRRSSRRSCAARRTSASRSTRCREGSSARDR